ncbi:MAG: DsbA family protein [Hyphomonadaceae bacterium]|nr:DsbA family protein [Hyphomonadaceae bacterium]
MSGTRMTPVELWIDVICPWCLIGLTRLQRAADAVGLAPDIRLRAFRLHRDWPVDGMAWRDFQTCRNLSDAVFEHVAAVGRADGLPFDFGRVARVPDTTAMHRILNAAARERLALPVFGAMAEAYFFAGVNLADADSAVAAAVQGGMTREAAEHALASARTLDAVIADEQEAQRLRVRGVPFLRVGDAIMAGAQPIGAYADLLQRSRLPFP